MKIQAAFCKLREEKEGTHERRGVDASKTEPVVG